MIETEAIYRVFYKDDFIGTAFAISPDCFLTCKHLFENKDKKDIFLRGSGEKKIRDIEWQEHSKLDCAFGIASVEVKESLVIENNDCINTTETFKFRGYMDSSNPLANWDDKYSTHNTMQGWVAIQGTYAKGMSGSPVFLDDQVVAIGIGDHFGNSQKYIIPLNAVWNWLEHLLGEQGIQLIKPIQSEQIFVDDLYLNLRSEVPQVIFKQKGRSIRQIKNLFIGKAQQDFEPKNILILYPPSNENCLEKDYFQQLARQCDLKEPCENSNHWYSQLSTRLEQEDKLFLLITDCEKGNHQLGQQLAKHLRQLQDNSHSKLEIVIIGGERLAKQVFFNGGMSFLNNACAGAKYLPELQLQDLIELSQNYGKSWNSHQLQKILNMTGGHPALIYDLLKQNNIPNKLNRDIVQRFFIHYHDNQQVKYWLRQEKIIEFEDWSMDEWVRDLYWNNLLVRKNDWFYWRCNEIREIGLRMLKG